MAVCEKGGRMFRKLAKIALPFVVLATIAALTVGMAGGCLPQSITIQF